MRAGPVTSHKRSISVTLLSLILIISSNNHARFVSANFFARQIQPKQQQQGDDCGPDCEGGASAPAGASSNMGSEAQVGSVVTFSNGAIYAKLVNNNRIPLVGYGVGTLKQDLVKGMVASALQDNKKVMLIDTAHASHNEHLVAQGIVKGVEKLNNNKKTEVHVVTKVWYTHLGYERTMVSIHESLDALRPAVDHDKVDLKLHVLLHWPRCYATIPWMDCEREEQELPDSTREAGPDPSKDPVGAWKDSWRALEDVYLSDQYPIASIGLSNFHLKDIEQVESFAQIRPHMLQMNLWSLLYDTHLIDYCHQHRIHVQAYGVVQGTVANKERAPQAYRHLQKVANDLTKEVGTDLTPVQVVLGWLIQHGISVIPQTTNVVRLEENSAVSLLNVPAFSDHQVDHVARAVEAYLSGDDLEDIHVSVTFHAVSKDIMLYWVDGDDQEVFITWLQQGQSFEETTFPKHKFKVYNAQNKDHFDEHEVTANYGEQVHVEL